MWIFDKYFGSKVMARKSQYANEQLPLATVFSPFRVLCIHQCNRYILTGGTLSKRSLFSPPCTSWMLLWRQFNTSIHLPRTRSTSAGTCARFFRGRKFLKLFKSLTVGQAVPEIPLSVGSKLELLRAFAVLP